MNPRHALGALAIFATLCGASAAQAEPGYAARAKAELRKQIRIADRQPISIRTTRIYRPPAQERTRLYELRDGKFKAMGWTGGFDLRINRSGRVKVSNVRFETPPAPRD